MRIALFTHHYSPESNAPQKRWEALIQRFITTGHEVVVYTPPPHYPEGTLTHQDAKYKSGQVHIGKHGETIIRVRFREHGLGLVSRSMDQLIAALDTVFKFTFSRGKKLPKPDVIISTAPGLPSIAAGHYAGFFTRRPNVVEIRDAWPDLLNYSGIFQKKEQPGVFARILNRITFNAITRWQKKAAAIVTTTESYAQVLQERGIKEVRVIRNGVTVSNLNPISQLLEDTFKIAYIGTVGRSQGLAQVVEASAQMAAHGVNVEVKIIGTGAELQSLKDLAKTLAAPVEFPGRIEMTEVRQYQEWANTLLVSLRDWKPFHWTVPSKLYESLALGKHITAVVSGEAAELVKDLAAGHVSVPGQVSDLVDLWVQLAKNPELLTVSDRGQRWALENVHYDRLAAGYLELLDDLVSGKANHE